MKFINLAKSAVKLEIEAYVQKTIRQLVNKFNQFNCILNV